VPSHRDIVTCCIFAVEELFGVVPKSRHLQKLSMEKAWDQTPGRAVNEILSHKHTEEACIGARAQIAKRTASHSEECVP